MQLISRSRFAGLLRGLSEEEFVSFVADLWDGRGWTTTVRGDVVVASRDRATGDRHVLLTRHDAPVLDRVEWATDRTDVTHVVTSGSASRRAVEFADETGARLLDRSDLYEMAVYALDPEDRETLFRRHFDRPATVEERSGVVGATGALLRTPRGKIAAFAIALLLLAVTTGAVSLGDDSPEVPGANGDGPRVVTASPEPFTVSNPDSIATAGTPTPETTVETPRVDRHVLGGNVTPGSGDTAWRMFRGDRARTAFRPEIDGPLDDVGIMARFDADFGLVSSPAVVNGTVYVGAVDGILHALGARSLRERWAHYMDGAVISSPAVTDGTVYIGSTNAMNPGLVSNATDRMHAVDTTRGRNRWNASTGPISTSSPLFVNGSVYVGSMEGKVFALDAETGAVRWNVSTNGTMGSSPAFSDGSVYIGSDDGRVYAIDAADGTIRWNASTNGSVISTPAVVGGLVYAGSEDGNVYAFDAGNGSVVWEYPTEGPVVSSPAVANGTVYIGSADGRLYALEADSGRQRWAEATDGGVVSSPVVANATVYVGGLDGQVYALDAASGDRRWTYDLGSRIESSPAVTDNVLYVGTNDGTLYALVGSSRE